MARNYINRYETIDFNIPYDEALEEIGVDYICAWLGESVNANPATELEDPAKRPELIVALRKMGYTVESS